MVLYFDFKPVSQGGFIVGYGLLRFFNSTYWFRSRLSARRGLITTAEHSNFSLTIDKLSRVTLSYSRQIVLLLLSLEGVAGILFSLYLL